MIEEMNRVIREASQIRLRVKVDRLLESAAPSIGSIELTVEWWMTHGDSYNPRATAIGICGRECECRNRKIKDVLYPPKTGLITRTEIIQEPIPHRRQGGGFKWIREDVLQVYQLDIMPLFDDEEHTSEYSYWAVEEARAERDK